MAVAVIAVMAEVGGRVTELTRHECRTVVLTGTGIHMDVTGSGSGLAVIGAA